MSESELGRLFWFSAATAGKDARNVTYKQRIKTTLWMLINGSKKDVSKFRAFGCRAYIHLNEDRRNPGKHVPWAIKAINLGVSSDQNTSGYILYIQERRTITTSNQVNFDEQYFPYCKKS